MWTHCGPIKGHYVIESIGPPFREWLKHSLFGIQYPKQYGVVRTPISDFVARYQEVDIKEIDGDVEIAVARLGMPFDMIGLICAYIKINWHDPLKDFCVETTAHAIHCIENYWAHKETPGHIHWLCSPVANAKELLLELINSCNQLNQKVIDENNVY